MLFNYTRQVAAFGGDRQSPYGANFYYLIVNKIATRLDWIKIDNDNDGRKLLATNSNIICIVLYCEGTMIKKTLFTAVHSTFNGSDIL